MKTIELQMSVCELPDYNEMGAKPTENTYDLIIVADVDVHARTIGSVHIYDTAYMVSVNFNILTTRDQKTINARILDFITNNIDFLLDSLKEQKQDSDFEAQRDYKTGGADES